MSKLRKRGLVTVVICTDPPFKPGGAQSWVFPMRDLPLIVIRHLMGEISLEKVEGREQVTMPEFTQLKRKHVK
jgi:hypothetical protein